MWMISDQQENKKPENGQGHASGRGVIELPGIPEEESNIQATKTGTTGFMDIPEKELTGQPPRTLPDTTPGADTVGPDVRETPGKPGKKKISKKKPPIARPVTEVYRKTEMPGMSAKSFAEDPAQIRRRTERDLRNPEFAIPYTATEKAVRDLVCSLMEREDRIHEGILLDINCVQQDIGMLKDQVYTMKTVKSGPTAGEKK